MVSNQKRTGTAMSIPAGLALGGAVSLALTLAFSAVIALLAVKGIISESSIGYGVMLLLLISATLGTATANAKIKRRKLMISGLSGLIYYAILLAITALFFGGQYKGMGVTALMILAGSGLQLLTGQQGRGGRNHKRYKTSHR